MKTSTWILLLSLSLLGLLFFQVAGCGSATYLANDMGPVGSGGGDDGSTSGGQDGSQQTGGDMAGMTPVTVVGTWLSTGANLAKGFTQAPFNVQSITGVFKADSTYSVTSVDMSGKMTTSAGTWTSMPSSVAGIFDFQQNQTQPSAATAKGIYQIDATQSPPMLTLEGVQVSPSLGASPPTAAQGFGSTTVNGQKTSDWIQKYVRQ
jgi:hypothetical protein